MLDFKIWTSINSTIPGGSKSTEVAPVMSDLANHVAAVIPDKWKKVAVQLGLESEPYREMKIPVSTSSWQCWSTGSRHTASHLPGPRWLLCSTLTH